MLSKSKGVNAHLVGIDATGQDIGRTGPMRGNVGLGSDCRTRVGVVGTGSKPSATTIITAVWSGLGHTTGVTEADDVLGDFEARTHLLQQQWERQQELQFSPWETPEHANVQ
ncbi:uncharacterized protein EDB93DRAFT_1105004 [Suillus bovinus]|uniref:uncharacterized protein n=1 Tax=Suillus bovinus TaxID=48563 RepID=UPI001B86AD5B|nr:uncharacterized protein EDB93DRAFT_1105004 [Suillus bovinus]KAG2144457.1 hypothetical protein EDB93DRAFT_1105004 [Suillus bovinus]